MGSAFDRCLAGLAALAAGASLAAAKTSSTEPPPSRDIYRQYCASCHGPRGEGAHGWERPDANGELPAPPHDRHGHTWKHSDEMLYRLVQQGWRDPFNKSERLTMPAFKGRLSRAETVAVIDYLKSLWSPKQRRFQAEESRGHPFPQETP